jgi:hypothetical protein
VTSNIPLGVIFICSILIAMPNLVEADLMLTNILRSLYSTVLILVAMSNVAEAYHMLTNMSFENILIRRIDEIEKYENGPPSLRPKQPLSNFEHSREVRDRYVRTYCAPDI